MAGEKQMFQDMGLKYEDFGTIESSSVSDSFTSSSCVSTSSDLTEDDASSSSASSSSGPLFELSELMAQLPIKRGLSKFYHGKSQTFGCLANVRSLEDLAEESCCYSQRMKSCKSFGGNLNQRKFGPKPTIRKRSSPANRSISPNARCF